MLLQDLLLRGAGGVTFAVYNHATWRAHHYVLWALLIVGLIEVLSQLILSLDSCYRHIPSTGKPLATLTVLDHTFIIINKLVTSIFTYHMIHYCWYSSMVEWSTESMTIINTLGAVVLLYFIYDFWYTLFHRALHMRSVYGYIHKHHHRQMAPFRGNMDAVNVHPFEFATGEYNHLFSLVLCTYIIRPHVVAVFVFILLGGIMASLNHTRFDVRWLGVLFRVEYHDLHHWQPNKNFGQYTMFWDMVMGSFTPYPANKKKIKPVYD